MTEASTTTEPDYSQLNVVRVLDAPRELVFNAFVEPAQLAKFWSPAGMSIPLSSVVIDPRPGGPFEALMVSDTDGAEYPMKATYIEVSPPERIVFTIPSSGMVSTMTFTDVDGKTELSVHQTNIPGPLRNAEVVAGLNSTFDRLAEVLADR